MSRQPSGRSKTEIVYTCHATTAENLYTASSEESEQFEALDFRLRSRGIDPARYIPFMINLWDDPPGQPIPTVEELSNWESINTYEELHLLLPSKEQYLRAAIVEAEYKRQMLLLVEIRDDRQFTEEDWDYYHEWIDREFSWLAPQTTFQKAQEDYPELYVECQEEALQALRVETGVGPEPKDYKEIAIILKGSKP